MLQAQRTVTKITPNATAVQESPKLRTAAYCRVSTDSSDQEHSFAAQVKYYTEMLEKLPDSTLVDIINDDRGVLYVFQELSKYPRIILIISLKQTIRAAVEIILNFS